jgi:arylsulfatase A-like enzyme
MRSSSLPHVASRTPTVAFNQKNWMNTAPKWLPLLAALQLMSCSDQPTSVAPAGSLRPNIVLLISDDHDYEHLGFMGSDVALTPAIDQLAEQGVVFDIAYVPSSRCRPSLAALLSGRWPHQSGIATNQGGARLAPDNALPMLLANAGYATYLGGKFWEGDIEKFGFSEQHYSDKYNFIRKGQEQLFDFIDQFANKQPLFIWWAPMLPHLPHDPSEDYLARFDPETLQVPGEVPTKRIPEFRKSEHLSLAMEAWLDDGVKALHTKLSSKGLLEDTLFIFLIDNGYANGYASKGTAYEKGLRTPIVFSQPGALPSGQKSHALVSTLDLYPTILDYAGLVPPQGLEGRSLRPIIQGESSSGRTALFGLQYEKILQETEVAQETAIALYNRDERWKYILYLQDMPRVRQRSESAFSAIKIREWRRGQEELFDLDQDPYELSSLHGHGDQRARMDRMRTAAEQWLLETGAKNLRLP